MIQLEVVDPRECLLVVPLLHRMGLMLNLLIPTGSDHEVWCGRLLHRAPARRRSSAVST